MQNTVNERYLGTTKLMISGNSATGAKLDLLHAKTRPAFNQKRGAKFVYLLGSP